MKRRVISMLVLIALLFSMVPMTAPAAKAEGAYQYYEDMYPVEGGYILFDEGSGEIYAYEGNITSADIPAEINGVAVTSIGGWAFEYCYSLTSVTIPDSVTRINAYAFYGCYALESVTLGDGLESIDAEAFRECQSLQSIALPAALTYIGDDVFYNCVALESIHVAAENEVYSSDASGVLFNKAKTELLLCPQGLSGVYTIPNGVENIVERAFMRCTALTNVSIPGSVQSIGAYAFYECGMASLTIGNGVKNIGLAAFECCGSLQSVAIPASVTSLGDDAFRACRSLTSATIGSGVSEIGTAVFASCTALESVVLPQSVKSIGDAAFNCCNALSSINIPDGVTSIGYSAFYQCNSLQSITLPDSVTSIGNSAFAYCTSLKSIALPAGVTSVSAWAFSNCTELTEVTLPQNVTSIENGAFFFCESLQSIDLPDGVTSIGERAFYSCDSLTSVAIPANVTYIGELAFAYCPSLLEFVVDEANENYSSDEYGTLFNKDKTELLVLPGACMECWIPATFEWFDENALVGCDNLVAFRVDEAHPDLSSDESGLLLNKDATEVILAPNGLNVCQIAEGVVTIGEEAFVNCSNLITVFIPQSVEKIKWGAFRNWTLNHVFYAGTIDQWNEIHISSSNSPLIIATKHCEATAANISLEQSCVHDLYYCDLCEEDNFIGAVKRIGGEHDFVDGVCSVCGVPSYLKYYIESNGTVVISGYDRSVSDIVIPETIEGLSVATIGGSAFMNNTELESAKIAESVTYISYAAFENCTSLKQMEFPGVTHISYSAFMNCTSLPQLEFPSVVHISYSAFENCTSLTQLELPVATYIGEAAFANCTSMTKAKLPVATKIYDQTFVNCTSLEQVEFPTVTDISYYAFADCTSLSQLQFPQDLRTISDDAFYNCDSLTKVELGANVDYLSYSAFDDCDNLEGIHVDKANKYYSSDKYGTLYTKDKWTLIQAGCALPATYVVPADVGHIVPGAFATSRTLEILAVLNPACNFYRYYWWAYEPQIPEGVTLHSDGDSNVQAVAEKYGYSFTEHNFENGACTICKTGSIVWQGVCGDNLTYTIDESDGKLIIEGDGLMYSFSCAAPWESSKRYITEVSLPDGLLNIGALAFENCVNLKKIAIPDSVSVIENSAFLGCESLEEVDFGEGVYSIEEQAFGMCTALTDAVLPETTDFIGRYAFASSGLTSIEIPNRECAIYPVDETLGTPGTTVVYGYEGSTAQDYAENHGYTFIALCEHVYTETVTAPTCTEGGYTTYVCEKCGESYVGDNTDALGHDFEQWKTTTAPTCTVAGVERRDCARCDAYEERALEALGHTYTEALTVPTCTEGGYTTFTCHCGDSYVGNETEAFGHEFGEWTTVTAATCTNSGKERRDCSACDAFEERNVAKLAHNYEAGVCESCGAEDPNYVPPTEEPSEPEIPTENPFTDVKESDYFATPVLWAVGKGITNGMSATSFAPNAPCTRGQIVTFLWRACGSPEPTRTNNPFTDVKSSEYYYKAVLWAVEQGITTGLSATTFGPNATCTRGQVATFLWRSQGEPAPASTNNPFSDVKTSDYYCKAVLWAVENNVTQGVGGGKFAPNDSCTRGQIVTFLYRAIA